MDLSILIPIILIPILLLVIKRINIKKLSEYESIFPQTVEVFLKYDGEKVLTLDKYPQGISIDKDSIKKSYWYFIAQKVVDFCKNKKGKNTLMLGLGANTSSSLIEKLDPEIKQTVVEIDPAIIQACTDHFNLNGIKNLNLIKGDAFKIVKEHKKYFKSKFDVITVDIYWGKAPYISVGSKEPSFVKQLKNLLQKDGMILFNRPTVNKEIVDDIKEWQIYLETLFKNVEIKFIKDPRGFKNSIICVYN